MITYIMLCDMLWVINRSAFFRGLIAVMHNAFHPDIAVRVKESSVDSDHSVTELCVSDVITQGFRVGPLVFVPKNNHLDERAS